MKEKYLLKNYFVPTEEDLKFGYIFEIKYDPEGWQQEIFGKQIWNVSQMHHMLGKKYKWEEIYRVKYLDKEDILSLGWQLMMRSPNFEYEEDESIWYYFQKGKYFLKYWKNFDNNEGFIEVYENFQHKEGDNFIFKNNEPYHLFEGNCKSINELKILFKFLKIE